MKIRFHPHQAKLHSHIFLLLSDMFLPDFSNFDFYVLLGASLLTIFLLTVLVFLFVGSPKKASKQDMKILADLEKQRRDIQLELAEKVSALESVNKHYLQQTMIIRHLNDQMKGLRQFTNYEGKQIIKKNQIDFKNFTRDNNWRVFERNFSLLHPGVLEKLRSNIPNLSVGEYRTVCFMYMNLKNSEIASIMMKSISSVRSIKFRLRKKLKISTDEEVVEYLKTICESLHTNNVTKEPSSDKSDGNRTSLNPTLNLAIHDNYKFPESRQNTI